MTGYYVAIDGITGSQASAVSLLVARKLYNRRKRKVVHVNAFSPHDLVLPCSEWGFNSSWLSPLTKFGWLFGQYLQVYSDHIEPALMQGAVVVSHRSLQSAITLCSQEGNGREIMDMVQGFSAARNLANEEVRLTPDSVFWVPSERRAITAHVNKHFQVLGKIEAKEYEGAEALDKVMQSRVTVLPHPASDEDMADIVCQHIYKDYAAW